MYYPDVQHPIGTIAWLMDFGKSLLILNKETERLDLQPNSHKWE